MDQIQIEAEINRQQKRKDNYRNLEKQLKESGETQISVSDPESSGNTILFEQYKSQARKLCAARSECTRSKTARLIHRSEFAEYYEVNRRNFEEKEHLYKRRQAIVEHPFGTIKRQWGFSYILTKKGMGRASFDVGFMFIAYNLRRIGNILTCDQLKEYLRILLSLYLAISDIISDYFRQYKRRIYLEWLIEGKIRTSLKPV